MVKGQLPETFGRYRIHGILGSGGMGTVFRALDPTLMREVAVKIVRPAMRDVATIGARFRREALALARLSHPAIVRVFDMGQEGDQLFLVMELLEGHSLEGRASRDTGGASGPPAGFSVKELLDTFTPLAEALSVVHKSGLFHRDIKPANIIVGVPQRGAVLTDFGLAFLEGDARLTQEGGLVGSFRYMAPEQAAGEQATAASDVFSLGACMYEYATGIVPFETIPAPALLGARLTAELPPIGQVAPWVPAPIAAIIDRAVQVKAEDRHRSARELHRALVRAGRDFGIESGGGPELGSATPAMGVERAAATGPSPRWAVGTVALTALLLVAAAAWRSVPQAARPPEVHTPEAVAPPAKPPPLPAAGLPIVLADGAEGAPSGVIAACGQSLLAVWCDSEGRIRARRSGDEGRTWHRPAVDGKLAPGPAQQLSIASDGRRFMLLYTAGGDALQAQLLAVSTSAEATAWTSPALLGLAFPGWAPSIVAGNMADGTRRWLVAWQCPKDRTSFSAPAAVRWGDASTGEWLPVWSKSAARSEMEQPLALLTPEEGCVIWRWMREESMFSKLVAARWSSPKRGWTMNENPQLPGRGMERHNVAGFVDDDRQYLLWVVTTLFGSTEIRLVASRDGFSTLESDRAIPGEATNVSWGGRLAARGNRVWIAWHGQGDFNRTWTTSHDGGRKWSKAVRYAPGASTEVLPSLTVDGSGRAWICWGEHGGHVRVMPLP